MPRTTIKELREKIEALEKEKEEFRKQAESAKARLIGQIMTFLGYKLDRPHAGLSKAYFGPSLTPLGAQVAAQQQAPAPAPGAVWHEEDEPAFDLEKRRIIEDTCPSVEEGDPKPDDS